MVLISYHTVNVLRITGETLSNLLPAGLDKCDDEVSDDMRRCPIGSNVNQLRAIAMLANGVVRACGR